MDKGKVLKHKESYNQDTNWFLQIADKMLFWFEGVLFPGHPSSIDQEAWWVRRALYLMCRTFREYRYPWWRSMGLFLVSPFILIVTIYIIIRFLKVGEGNRWILLFSNGIGLELILFIIIVHIVMILSYFIISRSTIGIILAHITVFWLAIHGTRRLRLFYFKENELLTILVNGVVLLFFCIMVIYRKPEYIHDGLYFTNNGKDKWDIDTFLFVLKERENSMKSYLNRKRRDILFKYDINARPFNDVLYTQVIVALYQLAFYYFLCLMLFVVLSFFHIIMTISPKLLWVMVL